MKPESVRWLPRLQRVKLNFISESFLKEEKKAVFNLKMKQSYKINSCFIWSDSLTFCLHGGWCFCNGHRLCAQVAIIRYSDDPRTEFKLNAYKTKETLLEAIQQIAYKGGNTKTGERSRDCNADFLLATLCSISFPFANCFN